MSRKSKQIKLDFLSFSLASAMVIIVAIMSFFIRKGFFTKKVSDTFAIQSSEVVCEDNFTVPVYECGEKYCFWRCESENIYPALAKCLAISCPNGCVTSVDENGCDYCVCKR